MKRVPLLVVCANATARIGSGHVVRCLALAQAWMRQGGEVVFLSYFEESTWAKRLDAAGVSLVALQSDDHNNQVSLTLEALQDFPKAPVVLDGYDFSPQLRREIREAGHWLLCLDDVGSCLNCDALLNQNLGAELLFPAIGYDSHLLLGPRFALLREEFVAWRGWQRPIRLNANRVLVTLGGSDPYNRTYDVVSALRTLDGADWQVRVLLGASYKHDESIFHCIGADQRFEVVHDAQNMPQQLAWADIAVAGAGSVCWELAFMGLPALLLVCADNQRLIAQALKERGFAFNLGEPPWNFSLLSETVKTLASDLAMRRTMGRIGQDLVDGIGADRVAETIARIVVG